MRGGERLRLKGDKLWLMHSNCPANLANIAGQTYLDDKQRGADAAGAEASRRVEGPSI